MDKKKLIADLLTIPEARSAELASEESEAGEMRLKNSNGEEVLDKVPVNVELDDKLSPSLAENPSYVSVNLTWSRSFSYNKVELSVRISKPVKPGLEIEAAKILRDSLDSVLDDYSSGRAEELLMEWYHAKVN